MYAIDFMTCTADAVIDRSAACHPTLFAEALREVALTHTRAARSFDGWRQQTSRKIAEGMAKDCARMADRLLICGHVTNETDALTFGEKIQAFSVAARLQCVPHALAAEIIER